MKCESCGQEILALQLGDIVSIKTPDYPGLATILYQDEGNDIMRNVTVLFLTGNSKGARVWCLAYEVKVEHGYIHINRNETDYTRHTTLTLARTLQ